ncbi:MAG: glycosyltransferase family 4 protein [Planctomycetes bacterium]|nr:glycosyltransferase family 4 protein [Planctomycetota bacterium]
MSDKSAPMRILLIHRYFWPDSPPYASMLRVMGRHFVGRGHEVTVLTAQPSYTQATSKLRRPAKETLDGMRVLRRPMLPGSKKNWLARIANVALFQWHVLAHILFRRSSHYDVVIATTMPPVLVSGTACFAAHIRGAKFLYHCMDLYPEIAVLSRSWLIGRGPLPWLLGRLDRRTCRKAWRVVVLSEDMRQALARRGTAMDNVRVLNNFALEAQEQQAVESDLPAQRHDECRVLFAGNVGQFQGLEVLIEAAHRLAGKWQIQFHFLGDGAMRSKLESEAGGLLGKSVHFHGFRPLAEALQFMETADLGVVSLRLGVISFAFPSKTMTYLSSGLPLLAMVEPGSSLAQLVEENDLGVSVPQGDSEAMAEAIADFAVRGRDRKAEHERVRAFAEQEFGSSTVLARWDRLLAE